MYRITGSVAQVPILSWGLGSLAGQHPSMMYPKFSYSQDKLCQERSSIGGAYGGGTDLMEWFQ